MLRAQIGNHGAKLQSLFAVFSAKIERTFAHAL